MQLNVNWVETPLGVGLKWGQKVNVSIDGNPDFIAWGIWNGHFPLTIGQTGDNRTTKNAASFILKNTQIDVSNIKALTLKVWAYQNNNPSGFEITFRLL